jgi:hypothetical protein
MERKDRQVISREERERLRFFVVFSYLLFSFLLSSLFQSDKTVKVKRMIPPAKVYKEEEKRKKTI